MKSIRSFIRAGFQGLDSNLATSLFEYRLIWRQIGKNHQIRRGDPRNYQIGSWQFVAPCLNRKGFYSHFFFNKEVDMKKEFNWISESDWAGFLSFVGADSFAQWDSHSFPSKIFDLINYYGQENVMGNDYGAGVEVREE